MSVITESEIRTKLPYMSEEFYALSSYFAQALGDNPDPIASLPVVVCVMDDVSKGSCGFARKMDFPEIFIKRKEFVQAEFPNLVYYIDEFLPDVAEIFRAALSASMNCDVPKLKHAKFAEDVPENIRVATEWWLQQIQHPYMDNGEPTMSSFVARFGGGCRAKPTDVEVEKFTEIFVKKLSAALMARDGIELRVDYFPWDDVLASIEEELKFGQFVWPCKTAMLVYKDRVEVSLGYGAEWKTIWSAE